MMKTEVTTPKAPQPIGPFSQAVVFGNTIYVSAQLALEVTTGKMILDDIESETRQVMENLKAILSEAGASLANVAKASIFLKNILDYERVNKVYGSYFSEPFPARETFQVSALPKNVNIEISLIAIK